MIPVLKGEIRKGVAKWLREFLCMRYPEAEVVVEETMRRPIAWFLRRERLLKYFPIGFNYLLNVDVCGAVILLAKGGRYGDALLTIVQIQTSPISLKDLGKFAGCAKIIRPAYAFLISPEGWSGTLHRLVRDFGRTDILEYAFGRYIVVAKWDIASQSVRPGEVLTYGKW